MNWNSIEIVRPGAFTTVQDLGRPGRQRYGVTVGGAMDRLSASTANILAGNDINTPLLEITLLGPHLLFHGAGYVGLAGGALGAVLNGDEIGNWRGFRVDSGDLLAFNGRRDGARAYVAFSGGLIVERIMGSCATDVRSRFGGFSGRILKSGDILYIDHPRFPAPSSNRFLPKKTLEEMRPNKQALRVLKHDNTIAFQSDVWSKFLSGEYTILPNSDRMGIRLDGIPLPGGDPSAATRISEPVCAGTIQLPPSGQPIILTAERQTVGGYPVLGSVITVDIGTLSQMVPGDTVRFAECSLEEAQDALRAERAFVAMLRGANR